MEQRGIFDKEVDQAVSEGRVDFAVHNMKDVPVNGRNTRLVIASVPERSSPAEVLVSNGDRRMKDMVAGGRIGTSSPIRLAQLRRARPDVKPEPLFGDVETRIERVDKGELDGVILAEAGLAKLGIAERISERLSIDEFMPAPGQGALARGNQIQVKACIVSVDGKERLFATRSGNAVDGTRLAHEIGEELLAKGAGRIGETWRNARH